MDLRPGGFLARAKHDVSWWSRLEFILFGPGSRTFQEWNGMIFLQPYFNKRQKSLDGGPIGGDEHRLDRYRLETQWRETCWRSSKPWWGLVCRDDAKWFKQVMLTFVDTCRYLPTFHTSHECICVFKVSSSRSVIVYMSSMHMPWQAVAGYGSWPNTIFWE